MCGRSLTNICLMISPPILWMKSASGRHETPPVDSEGVWLHRIMPPPRGQSSHLNRRSKGFFVVSTVANLHYLLCYAHTLCWVCLHYCNCFHFSREPPTVISPLSVSIQSSGKKRLILDLRRKHILTQSTC